MDEKLTLNLFKLHTTEKTAQRIRKNMGLSEEEVPDVDKWCKDLLSLGNGMSTLEGKYCYVYTEVGRVAIDHRTYTIITVRKHPERKAPRKRRHYYG